MLLGSIGIQLEDVGVEEVAGGAYPKIGPEAWGTASNNGDQVAHVNFSDFLKLQQLLPDTSRHSNWGKLTFQTESLKITQNHSR